MLVHRLFVLLATMISLTGFVLGQPAPEIPFVLKPDIQWAAPEGHPLTMDIYTPLRELDSYPVIIVIHGGGWLINDKSIMNDASAYLASHGDYVVCNINYRLLPDQENTVTMDEIIEDVFGAVLWVKDHITEYGGDPKRVIVTGDSAGGHLASSIVLMGDQLESDGFDGPTLGFRPSYLPAGQTAEEVAAAGGLSVQAAMISYGAFDFYEIATTGNFEKPSNFFWTMAQAEPRGIFGEGISATDQADWYQAVSPSYNVPTPEEQDLPPILFTVGSNDNLTTPASVEKFYQRLVDPGHDDLQFWVHEGRPHAFLDSGRNDFLGINFEDDGVPALDVMLDFLNGIFYPE